MKTLAASYNVSTGVESLVSTAKLVVDVGPILQLDGCVGSGGHGAGNSSHLVALVARLNFCNLADNLLGKLALDRRS